MDAICADLKEKEKLWTTPCCLATRKASFKSNWKLINMRSVSKKKPINASEKVPNYTPVNSPQ
jgi:hypothetical protein